MRGPLPWILVAVGILAVILVGAALGDDDSGETVPAGQWAQSTCGAVAVWRGAIEPIVEDIRTPNAFSTTGEEPQSETPQGRTAYVRKGLERAVESTETMVEGIENAGTPDSPEGEQAADDIATWAERALDELEEAEDSLEEEADSPEQSIEQFQDAVGAITGAFVGGAETIVGIAELDPALAAALRTSSTCQQLQEERGR